MEKPYLKCSFNVSLWKKWPTKISRFLTESPGFLTFFTKISRFVTLQAWQVCFYVKVYFPGGKSAQLPLSGWEIEFFLGIIFSIELNCLRFNPTEFMRQTVILSSVYWFLKIWSSLYRQKMESPILRHFKKNRHFMCQILTSEC